MQPCMLQNNGVSKYATQPNLPKPSSISSSPRLNVGPDPGTLHGVRLTPSVPKILSKHCNFNNKIFNTTSNPFMNNDSY